MACFRILCIDRPNVYVLDIVAFVRGRLTRRCGDKIVPDCGGKIEGILYCRNVLDSPRLFVYSSDEICVRRSGISYGENAVAECARFEKPNLLAAFENDFRLF